MPWSVVGERHGDASPVDMGDYVAARSDRSSSICMCSSLSLSLYGKSCNIRVVAVLECVRDSIEEYWTQVRAMKYRVKVGVSIPENLQDISQYCARVWSMERWSPISMDSFVLFELAWACEADAGCYREALLPLLQNRHFVKMNLERTRPLCLECLDTSASRDAYTGQMEMMEYDRMPLR